MPNFKSVAERFKPCPNQKCGRINSPLALFCVGCREKTARTPSLHFSELPRERKISKELDILEPSTHALFAGKTPEEFVDGVIKLSGGLKLSAGQEEIRSNLDFYLSGLKSALMRDAKFKGRR